jgi:hypothetical protein
MHHGGGYAGQRWRRLQPVVGCDVIRRRKKPGWPGGPLGPDRGGLAKLAGEWGGELGGLCRPVGQGRGSGNKRREEIGNGLGRWAEKGFWARIGK